MVLGIIGIILHPITNTHHSTLGPYCWGCICVREDRGVVVFA